MFPKIKKTYFKKKCKFGAKRNWRDELLKARVCGTAGTPDLPGSSRSAPDSIIGILIFKYPSNHHRPLIQLNFFRHILHEQRRKYFPVESSNAKQDGATTVKLIVSFPIQFFGATFKVTFSSVGDPTP